MGEYWVAWTVRCHRCWWTAAVERTGMCSQMHGHVFTDARPRVHRCTATCSQMHGHVFTDARPQKQREKTPRAGGVERGEPHHIKIMCESKNVWPTSGDRRSRETSLESATCAVE